MTALIKSIVTLWIVIISGPMAFANGSVSDPIRIESKVLGYALQYRVYTPDPKLNAKKTPSLYVTDGQWYLEPGDMKSVLDQEIASGRIKPITAIFVDSRDPDNLRKNLRTQQFFCNAEYADFYMEELIPTIEKTYSINDNREDRVILGLSFGGTNSACFGLMASQVFGGIAMQSPANDQHLKLLSNLYRQNKPTPIKIFFSIGNKKDNRTAGRKFKAVLTAQAYDLTYIEVKQGHSWKNWGPLLDDVLATFFK